MSAKRTRRFELMIAKRGGWCDWGAPISNGYLLKCCDCGLVHEMQFKAFVETEQKRGGRFTSVVLQWPFRVMFRARRERSRS